MNFLSVEQTFDYIPNLPQGYMVEFGVYHADCFRRLLKGSIDYSNPFLMAVGFDSFEGLPSEQEGIWLNPDWPPGAFSVKKDYSLASVEECMEFCRKRVEDFLEPDFIPFYFEPGFFDKSLTKQIGNELTNTVSYCHVDVDLYISTKQVLNWVFKYKLLKKECLIRFDDWLFNGQWAGNNRAWAEAVVKYNIKYTTIGDNVFVYEGQTK